MNLARRTFLRAGSCALVGSMAGLLPARASQSFSLTPPNASVRSLAFVNIHTGEKLSRDYWMNGQYDADALSAINRVLRDHRSGDVHAIDTRLLDTLHGLRQTLESDVAFEVISGYRSPLSNAAMHEKSRGVATKSLHMEGMAIDIRLPGKTLANVHEAALKLARGGVGYYPTSNFVHVDVGAVRKWSGV